MARQVPLTQAELDRIRDLHGRGYGRNAICRETGRSADAVTRACQTMGLDFDRTATKTAVAARKVDAARKRSELEDLLLDDALRLRAAVHQAHDYRDYGGKDFILRRWTQPEPTPVDKLKLMQAAGNAVDRAIRLSEMDRADEVEATRSMLGQLLTQLQVVAGPYDDQAAS